MNGVIPAALVAHPAFAPYRPQIDRLHASLLENGVGGVAEVAVGWAPRAHQAEAKQPVAQGDITVGRGCPPYDFDEFIGSSATSLSPGEREQNRKAIPTFVSPPAKTLSAIDFERRVVERNELVIRPDSLHDLLNALVWLTFPKTKRAISEAHVALGVNLDPKTRPRRRDVLTVFDESGMIVLSERHDLREMNRSHQWRELFVNHRADFAQHTRPIVFGHGAMEQLGQQLPQVHRGLTVKALWLPLPVNTAIVDLDRCLAERIQRGESLHEAERTVPLPVLGIPGWFAENEAPECYDDLSVFRPKRSAVS